MTIQLKKFGTVLVSRPAGKEAWLAYQPVLREIANDEDILVDFDKVFVLTPSWADEFITPLMKNFGGKVKLKKTSNPSVKAVLKIINQ
ncbi:DUF4325 domain-containing protein [Candidatus Roizmanbacteria bacterium CG22_combo_CG10-13_8_21_14_all_38_20]|uniref:DUF4325 domain-containing protein n=1 Tax=Candidatus Roizmanbacteria bacterium CG22_combo_CG10-13_8_21_14_all_38_20 TaxID=1974862 RepID=A0A2H0BVT1_9BACT|nr:DUF4325 domain-containing protein [Candidatus Microgenomates bacterium]PIP61785.1 MAG: DUF4325 domain-containing protein [Candidatus Roizmanbacteria bacterium CG22_combo_CG10-13_8_21_14_all_38_20]PJC30967.1 MAG: DUF4325 domain-containing protein [Candidatus Roizmanbacteria bacterium CG_4_9_14_0_2_um_filter_38_17]